MERKVQPLTVATVKTSDYRLALFLTSNPPETYTQSVLRIVETGAKPGQKKELVWYTA